MKTLLFSIVCTLSVTLTPVSAQSVSKKNKNVGFFNITQIGHNRGFGDINYRSDATLPNRGYLNRLRTTFGYFVKPEFSVGLGFGLERYNDPGYNTAPLVTDFRYYRRPEANSLFAVANAGYLLPFSESFASGAMGGFGLGYRLIAGRGTHLLFSAGLEAHQIRDARAILVSPGSVEFVEANIWLKSLSFNAGVLF